MKAGLEKPESRQFSPERGIIVSRRYFESRFGAAFTIPFDQLSNLVRLSFADSHNPIERRRRQVSRHQRRRAVERPISDRDGIAGNALEDFHARERIGQSRLVHAADEPEGRNQ